jgi:hypothetical protein
MIFFINVMDAGLYAKRYKQWIDMLTCTRGTWRIYAPMSALELSQIDFFKWYTNGEYRFLIKEIRFNIKRDRLSVAQLDILIK